MASIGVDRGRRWSMDIDGGLFGLMGFERVRWGRIGSIPVDGVDLGRKGFNRSCRGR